MNKPLKVLIVEDSESDAKLALRALRRGGFDPTFRRLQTAAELETALAQERWDAVISDFNMPGFTGMDALRVFRSTGLDIPFILVSGTIGEETAVEAMKAGASDYVMKDSLARLAPALERELKETQMRAAHRQAQRELIESEQRLRTIIETQPECVKVVNKEGVLLEMNAAGLAMLEAGSLAAVKSRALIEFIVPEYRAAFAALHQRVMRGESGVLEFEVIGLKGGRRWLETHAAPLGGANGDVAMLLGITRDITERKETAGRIAHLNRVYAVLSGINALIVRVRNRGELFKEACRIAVEEGGFRMSLVAIVDRNSLKIVPVASAGKDEDLLTDIKDILSSSERAPNTMVARAIREKQAVVSNESQSDPGVVFGKKYAESGVRSMAVLPLIVSDEAVGALALYASEIEFFHEEEMKLLTDLAGDISFALDHMARQEKIEKLSRIRAVSSGINSVLIRVRNREELFRQSCRVAVEDGQFPFAWIGALDPATLDVTPVAWAGESAEELTRAKSSARDDIQGGKGAVGRAIRARHTVFNNDVTAYSFGGPREKEILRLGFRSQITLPLFEEQTVVGTLTMYAREPNFFDDDEVTLLNEVAGNISFALEHIEKEDKIARLSRIQAVMGSVNALIVRVRDRQQLFRESCRIAVEEGQFPCAWIGVLDQATQDVVPVAWAGGGAEELTRTRSSARDDTPRGQGAVGRAIRERRPVFNNDIPAHSLGGPRREEILRLGFQSLIALPLLDDHTIIGTLALYVTEADFFDEEELRLLTQLAGDISFAVENIAKQQKLEKLSRIRAMLSAASSAIVRIHDRKQLLEEACRIAMELGKFRMSWIGTLDRATLSVWPVAWTGLDDDFVRQLRVTARGEGLAGQGTTPRAVRSKQPVVDNDFTANPGMGYIRRYAIERGVQSAISLPLLVEGEVTEVFSLYSEESGFFTEDETKVLDEMAADFSFALQSIGRQERLEKLSRVRTVLSDVNTAIVRIREREALLLETCRIAVEHGKFEMVWIGALDPAKQEVRPIAWEGFSTEAARAVTWTSLSAPGVTLNEVLQTRRPAIRNDIEAGTTTGILRREATQRGCRSTVCLPFVIDDSVVAAAILFSTGRGFFDEEEVALLNEVAGNISFALAHMEKEEKLARLSRIQAVLGSINALIVRVRDRQELFDEACRIAVEHGGFGIAWIGTLDPHTLDVTPLAHAGFETNESLANFKSSASVEHPMGRGVVGQAIRARIPVVADDLPQEPGAGERRAEAIRRGYRSRIALPLLVDDCVVGVMVLFARERAFFNEEELKLLSELAGDISFALEHIGKETKLNYLAYYDALTGLPNRTLFEERLSRLLHAAGENGTKVAVLLGNVNRFRFINESLGRQSGDALLRELAARVHKIWPDPDNVARISGDSFGGMVADLKDETELAHVPEPLVTGVTASSFVIENEELTIAMTAGIAVFPTDGKDADTLFRNAEAALKRAKASGERYLFYRPEMNARVAETLLLENKMRQALDREQFVLHYQPKVDLATGTISGLEALIRWNDPETGLVPPMKFIPLLEETGMILEAGRWAMQKAVADYREWHAEGLEPPRIAVNVSSIQLRQKDFVEVVRDAIGGAADGPHGLDLEITESLIMEDIAGNIEKLRAVRDMGVNIAIDDFGTGYSSLRYLAKLPVNALKIDRSFIITMTGSADSMTIVSTIISLAHALNLKVIAEGVDAEDQRKFLKLLKCDEMQGYLFSRPVPKNDVLALLQADSTVPA